jgi:Ca2+-binding EF-hand superfamily protein
MTGNQFTATNDYITEIRNLFNQLDLDEDGVIGLEEFKARKGHFKQFFEFVF